MRMSYRYAYKCSNLETFSGKILAALLKIFAGIEVGETRDDQKIKVAIIGAGNVGVTWQGNCCKTRWHPIAEMFCGYR